MRRAAKRDDSEAGIIATLEAHGARVQTLSGLNLPDLLVLYRGRILLAEVKTGRAKLKPGQRAFADVWPVEVLRTVQDATDWLMDIGPAV
jgi:hypothetical protein